MTTQDILDRLEDPRPMRSGELCEMTGYDRETVRQSLRSGKIEGVTLPGTSQPRIPIPEVRRILEGLRILQPATKNAESANNASADRKHLRFARA